MFGRRLIDAESVEWQFESFAWLIDRFSTGPGLPDGELWQPIDDHFPSRQGDLAPRLFEHVKRHYGFAPQCLFDLEPVEANFGGAMGGLASVQTIGSTAAATYQIEGAVFGQPKETIRYRSDSEATELVASFAHELAHAAHQRTADCEDVFDDLYELFTDLTAVYFGYGIFLANTRFEMRNFANADIQGWSAKGSGYLPEADFLFATALFMAIKDIPLEVAKPHLKPRLYKLLQKAAKQLGRHRDEVEALRTQVPAQPVAGDHRLGFVAT